jgi:hypothetical protein
MAKRKSPVVPIEDANLEIIEAVSVVTDTDPDMDISEKENNVFYSKNYFESEILFKIENQNVSEKFDFTDALIDLKFIRGIERAVLSRLEELGLNSESIKEYNIIPDVYPFVYSSAYPNGVLILDMTFDELKTMLVDFNK